MTTPNVIPGEVRHFDALASRWWDPRGEFGTLHDLNPHRVRLIDDWCGLRGRRVVDVGCGGGLLAEAMASLGANVTGIDASAEAIGVARLHCQGNNLPAIDYRQMTAEALASEQPLAYDVVTCLELLEHVPDPASLVAACARLARPGADVVFSTINRRPGAFVQAIVGAEYLTGLVPRGTHRYTQLIRPAELERWGRTAGLRPLAIVGLQYNPLDRQVTIGGPPRVNYFVRFRAPAVV